MIVRLTFVASLEINIDHRDARSERHLSELLLLAMLGYRLRQKDACARANPTVTLALENLESLINRSYVRKVPRGENPPTLPGLSMSSDERLPVPHRPAPTIDHCGNLNVTATFWVPVAWIHFYSGEQAQP